jgi:hypothetical protein
MNSTLEILKEKLHPILKNALIEDIFKSGNVLSFKAVDAIIDYDRCIKEMPMVLMGIVRVMKRDYKKIT